MVLMLCAAADADGGNADAVEVTENGADDLWNAGKSMLMLSAADGADPVVVTNNDEKMMLSTDTDGTDP